MSYLKNTTNTECQFTYLMKSPMNTADSTTIPATDKPAASGTVLSVKKAHLVYDCYCLNHLGLYLLSDALLLYCLVLPCIFWPGMGPRPRRLGLDTVSRPIHGLVSVLSPNVSASSRSRELTSRTRSSQRQIFTQISLWWFDSKPSKTQPQRQQLICAECRTLLYVHCHKSKP